MRPLLRSIAPVLLLLSVSAIRPARAAVPSAINVQGRLTTSTGAPAPDTTAQAITFRLYTALSGGTLLWTQTPSSVTVKGGVFQATLDFSTGFVGANTLDTALAGTPYLEVQAGGDAPMIPRVAFTSSPYALRAKTADMALSVPDGSITGAKIAPGTITSANLNAAAAAPLDVLTAGPDPRPVLRGTVPTGTNPNWMAVSGATACVVNSGSGTLQVFDVSNPAAPVMRGSAATANSPRFVAMSGNMAYVVNYNSSTLQVFDVSNTTTPALKGAVGTGNGVIAVAVSGNMAYVINYLSSTMQVFDVGNPTSPTLKGGVATGNGPSTLAVSGNNAYVVCSDGNLQVFDVSNPTSPNLKGAVAATFYPSSIAVSGSTAYVTNRGGNTLQVFDVSNPAAPVLKGSAATDSSPASIAVTGSTAYVVNGNSNTLQVFDVSNPASPKLTGSAATGNYPLAMAVSNGIACVLNYLGSSLQVFTFNQFQIGANLIVAGNVTVGGRATFAGNVGIGTTTPGFPLTFPDTLGDKISLWGQSGKSYGFGIQNGALQIHSFDSNYDIIFGTGPSATMVETAIIKGNGDFGAAGDVYARAVKLTSDGRFKKNVQTMDNALDAVLAMRGVTFDWDRAKWPARNFPEGQQVGFIAQEVEKVLPQVVGTDDKGYKSVAYQNIVPVLVEAVKTLKADNDDKAAQLAALQQQVASQRKQNAAVEARLKRLEERLDRPAASGRG